MWVRSPVSIRILEWQPTPVFFPEKFHEQKSLAGFSLLESLGLQRVGHTECAHTCKGLENFCVVLQLKTYDFQYSYFDFFSQCSAT